MKKIEVIIFAAIMFTFTNLKTSPVFSDEPASGTVIPQETTETTEQTIISPQAPSLSPDERKSIEESAKEAAREAAREEIRKEMEKQKEEKQKETQKASNKPIGSRGNFMDTRITWVFGDDDFLADAGEKIPDSPLLSIGDREGYELFMDNIDSRYTGRENLTHLVMYGMLPSFFPKLTTEAALVLKFQLSEKEVDMTDDGTYIRLFYNTSKLKENDGLGLVFFPFDTERFRLGYLWDISWGGGSIFTNKRNGWAPGMKLTLNIGNFNMFAGFKTAKVSQLQNMGPEGQPLSIQQTNYGALAGVGYDIKNLFKIDLGVGYFQQGTFEFEGIQGKPVYSFGGSIRIAFHKGMEVGMPADFALYRNMPEAEETISSQETYKKGGWGLIVSLEAAAILQHLADPDNYATTTLRPAYAGAGQMRLKIGSTRVHITLFLRSLEFILHNVPSFTPFVAIPESVTVHPEFFAAIGVDHYIAPVHLTPGIIMGIQLPASYTSGESTIVVRSEALRDILPIGDKEQPIFTGRVSLKWDLSSMLSFVTFIQYVRDINRTKLTRDNMGTYRIYTAENELGAALVLQARF